MKSEWIKIRAGLLTDPKVHQIAQLLRDTGDAMEALFGERYSNVTRNALRHVTVSLLVTLWSTANEHTDDGTFRNAHLNYIDDLVGVPGFGAALETVEWLIWDPAEKTITLPNFNEYNTSSIEARRKKNAERQARHRQKKQESNAKSNVTSDVTVTSRSNDRGEERREEESINTSPNGEEGRPPKKSPRFVKPNLNQLTDAFGEAGVIDPLAEAEKFLNHYESNGWRIGGKAPMKSWPHAVLNWAKRAKDDAARPTPPAPFRPPSGNQRTRDMSIGDIVTDTSWGDDDLPPIDGEYSQEQTA